MKEHVVPIPLHEVLSGAFQGGLNCTKYLGSQENLAFSLLLGLLMCLFSGKLLVAPNSRSPVLLTKAPKKSSVGRSV